MERVTVLFIVSVASLLLLLGRVDAAEDPETAWRPEAHRVALEALAKKYPRIVTQDVEAEIYRYSNSSVSLRNFSYSLLCSASIVALAGKRVYSTTFIPSTGLGKNRACILIPNHGR